MAGGVQPTRARRQVSRLQQLLDPDRQFAHAGARRVEDGVGDGGVEAEIAELAEAFDAEVVHLLSCAGDGIDINNIGVCREEVFGEVVFIAARRTAADLGGFVKGGAGAPDLATISWLFAVLGLMIWRVA